MTFESKSLSAEIKNLTFESYTCSLSVEAKEKFATIDSKCRLQLIKVNH